MEQDLKKINIMIIMIILKLIIRIKMLAKFQHLKVGMKEQINILRMKIQQEEKPMIFIMIIY